jgi:hypothetical protein
MTQKNPRINVTFDPAIFQTLLSLAHHEQQSMASLVRNLAIEALERREDLFLSTLAEERDLPGTPFVSHDQAWS